MQGIQVKLADLVMDTLEEFYVARDIYLNIKLSIMV